MNEEQRKLWAEAKEEAESLGFPGVIELLYLLKLLKAGDPSVSLVQIGYREGILGTLPLDPVAFDLDNLDEQELVRCFIQPRSEFLYDQAEAAEELGIEPRTIQRWGQGKKGVPSCKHGRRRLYLLGDLQTHARKLGHRLDWSGKIVATKTGPDGLRSRR